MNTYDKEIERAARCSRRLLAVTRKLKRAKVEEQPALVRRAGRLLAEARGLMSGDDV